MTWCVILLEKGGYRVQENIPNIPLTLDKGVMDPHFHLNEAAEIKTQEEEVIITSLLLHM